MFEVHFYEDKQGRQPIKELLVTLRDEAQNSKENQQNAAKGNQTGTAKHGRF